MKGDAPREGRRDRLIEENLAAFDGEAAVGYEAIAMSRVETEP